VPQADALDAMLAKRGLRLDAAVSLTAPEEELVRRMSARRECPTCKRAYNLVSAPPADGCHCDDHPTTMLRQRADDAPETVVRRLQVYAKETAPLLAYYRERGTLREVEGLGPMDEVYRTMVRTLGL
jgi:adenylate kinase